MAVVIKVYGINYGSINSLPLKYSTFQYISNVGYSIQGAQVQMLVIPFENNLIFVIFGTFYHISGIPGKSFHKLLISFKWISYINSIRYCNISVIYIYMYMLFLLDIIISDLGTSDVSDCIHVYWWAWIKNTIYQRSQV